MGILHGLGSRVFCTTCEHDPWLLPYKMEENWNPKISHKFNSLSTYCTYLANRDFGERPDKMKVCIMFISPLWFLVLIKNVYIYIYVSIKNIIMFFFRSCWMRKWRVKIA